MIQPRRVWKSWPIILFVILIVILVVLATSTIIILNPFSRGSATPTPVVSNAVGEVIFLNSGQLDAQNSQGVDDEVQISLHGIQNPSPGKSYYAWLKNTPLTGEGASILLGTLNVNQGN